LVLVVVVVGWCQLEKVGEFGAESVASTFFPVICKHWDELAEVVLVGVEREVGGSVENGAWVFSTFVVDKSQWFQGFEDRCFVGFDDFKAF
jgi:hypothetical protein